jgi:hypothetical protein
VRPAGIKQRERSCRRWQLYSCGWIYEVTRTSACTSGFATHVVRSAVHTKILDTLEMSGTQSHRPPANENIATSANVTRSVTTRAQPVFPCPTGVCRRLASPPRLLAHCTNRIPRVSRAQHGACSGTNIWPFFSIEATILVEHQSQTRTAKVVRSRRRTAMKSIKCKPRHCGHTSRA